MNPSMLKRLIALENIRKTFTPSCGRSREHIARLMTDVYDSLWLSDGGVLLSREERYTENLQLVEDWSHTSLQDKLEKYSGLFNEV